MPALKAQLTVPLVTMEVIDSQGLAFDVVAVVPRCPLPEGVRPVSRIVRLSLIPGLSSCRGTRGSLEAQLLHESQPARSPMYLMKPFSLESHRELAIGRLSFGQPSQAALSGVTDN